MTDYEKDTNPPLSELDVEILSLVSAIIFKSGLTSKYNQALQEVKKVRRDSGTLLADFENPNTPAARLLKAIFGSDPLPAAAETFFAIRIDPPLEEIDYKNTQYCIVQLDSSYGTEIEGSEVAVGFREPEGQLTVYEKLKDVFTIEDLILVQDLGENQTSLGFTQRPF